MTAPAWLADAIRITCDHDPFGDERRRIAEDVWEEMNDRANAGTLEFCYQLTFIDDEPKTIPARSTDPITSHKATEEIKIRAGSQRAYLLQAFGLEWFKDATDEEAMKRTGGWVKPNSEFAKRCSELREAGLIEPTGETRKGSSGQDRMVSRITDKGRAWIAANQ